MGLTPAVLAVDAGGTKTDVCVVSVDGEVLGRGRAGPFRPHTVGAAAALAAVAPAVESALAAAGEVGVERLTACLANVDFPAEEDQVRAALDRVGWAPTYDVLNDTYALLRAGTDDGCGVAVVCGTGINATGVRADGTTVRFAAVGWLSGDWGGGDHLWQEALWWAARAEDGRGPETALRTALPRRLGLDSMAAVIEAVHLGTVPPDRRHELVPELFAVAETGDAVAGDVVRRQAEEVVTLAATTIRRLAMEHQPVDVVLGGGVLAAGHALLMDAISAGLAGRAPHATARVVTAPPVLGAALLGLDRVGASGDALARVRAAFG